MFGKQCSTKEQLPSSRISLAGAGTSQALQDTGESHRPCSECLNPFSMENGLTWLGE
jgi:hypothetical protein